MLAVEKSVLRKRDTNSEVLLFANKSRKDGLFTDVTIKAGGEHVSAHRLVLSCYSEFFKGMFSSKFKEQHQDDVEIRGIDGKTVKLLVDFMYCGTIEITNNNVLDLLSGADFLQLDEVKRFCFAFLASIVKEDNCFTILNAAKLYRHEGIVHQVYCYIGAHLKEIAKTNGFLKLSKGDLSSCLSALQQIKLQKSSLFLAVSAWAKHGDQDVRRNDFFDLLHLVQLSQLSHEFLENVLLFDKSVSENLNCYKFVVAFLLQSLKNKMTDKLKTNQSGEFCLVAIGWSKDSPCGTGAFTLMGKNEPKFPAMRNQLFDTRSVISGGYVYSFGSKGFSKLNLNQEPFAWVDGIQMKQPRPGMDVAVVSDKIVVAGGLLFDTRELKSRSTVECFDPKSNKWNFLSSLKQKRRGHALVCHENNLYAIAGWDENVCLASVERLSNLEGKWEANIAPLETPRRDLAAVSCNGYIYAIGGQAGHSSYSVIRLKSVERYDPASNSNEWTVVKPMHYARSKAAACVINGKIYVVGGLDNYDNAVLDIECYNPSTDEWSIVGKSEVRLESHSLIAVPVAKPRRYM